MAQASSAFQQRVRNGQPEGGRVAEGTGPCGTIRPGRSHRLRVAESGASAYGCREAAETSVAPPSSTTRPRSALAAPVIAEGRVATPEQAARALAAGAHSVVVG